MRIIQPIEIYPGLKARKHAAKSAYKMAGISPDKIQLAEVHECYAHQELMLYEALGLCREGEAIQYSKRRSYD
jgi:acetyl-CoA C-acetyltransferase